MNVLEGVQTQCKEFRRALKRGERRQIEEYLSKENDSLREVLFQNLLLIDLDFRRRARDEPTSEEYIQRFPEFGRLIRQAFYESTLMSMDGNANTPAVDETIVLGVPAARRLGEYELLRELGRGGFGVVYAAKHLKRGEVVALKTLPMGLAGSSQGADDAERLHKFRQEFRQLSEVNHPNLVGMQTLEVEGNQWFLTMDLIDGVDFLEYVRPKKELDEERLRSALKQLVAGIVALHERGIVHRDLKPSNVLVSNDGRVTILDFGLVAELQRPTDHTVSLQSQNFAGTPRYAAPEQTAGTRSAAGDWYALGVMLYEALTGEGPFRGTAVQIIVKKQTEDAPQLAGRDGVADDLAALVDQLLQREPQARPDAATICEIVGVDDDTVSYSESDTGDSHASTPDEILLIGRDTQLAQLEEARQALLKGQEPVVIFVSGRSGEGKTSLIEKFLAPLRGDSEMLVLSGRCYDRESVPFKAIDSLIDALVAFLRSRGTDEVLLLLPDDVHLLAQLFPMLRRVPAIADRATIGIRGIDDRQIRTRAFSALRELLFRVSGSTSLMLFIDDLQWGDSDSAKALFELLSPPHPPNLLFLGSYRTDEADESPFLQQWRKLGEERSRAFEEQNVRVEPLTSDQCLELVARRVGVEAAQIRERASELFADTHGNPYFLEQLTEGFDAETGRFHLVPLHEIIDRRLKRLPGDASPLLQVISAAGQAVSLEEASHAAGDEKPAFGTITHMCSERLVRLIGSDQQRLLDTYHDKIRETVLANLSAEVRRGHHLSLARVIEADHEPLSDQQLNAIRAGQLPDKSPPRVFDLVYHFHQAGDEERTFAYAMLAARQARRQLALDSVLEHLEMARRFSGSSSNKVLFHIARNLGEALMLTGRYDEALSEFETAIELADNDFDRASVESFQGETHHRHGQFKECIACLESGLDRLGFRVPRSVPGLVIGILREVAVQFGHTVFPQRLHRSHTNPEAELVIRLLNWLSKQTIFENTFKLLYTQLAALNCAERFPLSAELAFSSAWHGMLMAMLGWHGRGRTYRKRGTDYSKQLGDIWMIGIVENLAGIGRFGSAGFGEALVVLEQSMATFGESGDPYFLGFVRFHRGCSHYMLGDLTRAIADASDTFEAAARIGDSRTMCSSWLWARATNGNLPFEELRKRIPDRPDDVMSTVHATMAEGLWHSYHGRSQESLEAFQAAAAMVRKTLCINSHTILVMPMLAQALRLRADDLQETDPRQCKELRSRSLRLANRAAWISRLFPNARPLMLRELSAIQRASGRLRSALKNADKSCAVAERQNATYELAQSRLLRGKLARQLKLPEADQQIQAAEAELERFDEMIRKACDAQ